MVSGDKLAARGLRAALSISSKVACRGLLAGAFAASMLLAGCGGSGGGSDAAATTPSAATTSVSGTAATGAPLAQVGVTLKDSANHSVSATTSATGAFTLDTTSLTPPFLLQVTTPGGTRLLSVSTDGNATATLNVTPITDLVVRSWYGVQGQSADTAFADPSAMPPPAPAQVRAIAQYLLGVLQLAINAANAPISDPLDLIAKPFAADGTGIDQLLDHATISVTGSAAQLVLVAGTATQTTALTFATGDTSISANTSTTDGSVTTTASSSSVVPVQGAQLQALDAINAALASFAATVNAKGSSLAVADLEPFFDANLLDDGLNRSQLLAGQVSDLQQVQDVSVAVDQLHALDATAGTAEAVVRESASSNGASAVQRDTLFFQRGDDGTWRVAGNGRIARVSVSAEGRRNQGTFSDSNGPDVNIDVRPVLGTVPSLTSSMTVDASFATGPVQLGAVEVLNGGVQLQPFFANTGPISGALPAAGTPVTITLQRVGGGTASYTVPLNAFTTELIQVTEPSGNTISPGTHTVTWTLPTTYAVDTIQLSALLFTDSSAGATGFQCTNDVPVVSPTATSGQITIDSTCNGQPVKQVNINVSTNGVNGERSLVIYGLDVTP